MSFAQHRLKMTLVDFRKLDVIPLPESLTNNELLAGLQRSVEFVVDLNKDHHYHAAEAIRILAKGVLRVDNKSIYDAIAKSQGETFSLQKTRLVQGGVLQTRFSLESLLLVIFNPPSYHYLTTLLPEFVAWASEEVVRLSCWQPH